MLVEPRSTILSGGPSIGKVPCGWEEEWCKPYNDKPKLNWWCVFYAKASEEIFSSIHHHTRMPWWYQRSYIIAYVERGCVCCVCTCVLCVCVCCIGFIMCASTYARIVGLVFSRTILLRSVCLHYVKEHKASVECLYQDTLGLTQEQRR